MSKPSPVRIVLFGASGRMGKSISEEIAQRPGTELAGRVTRSGKDTIGFVDADNQCVDARTLLGQADVAIDFTLPAGVKRHLAVCCEYNLPYVCGVTGLDEQTLAALSHASGNNAVLWAPNMSTGVTVCLDAAAAVASRLDSGFRVSIVDIHHAGKKDAPSGTALEFGRVIQAASSSEVEIDYDSVREGSHPGEHHIVFTAGTDVIELRHRAGSRREFAVGAVRAAQWLAEQSPGLYNMRNVLGITSSS